MMESLARWLEKMMVVISCESFWWGYEKTCGQGDYPQLWAEMVGKEIIRSLTKMVHCGELTDKFVVTGFLVGRLYRVKVFCGGKEVMRVDISHPNQLLPMMVRDGQVLGQPFHYCTNPKQLLESSEELLTYIIWPHTKVAT